jgi:NAD(P)-dependent dehydrogenase (short-subunit alcohol dehydrogenase family)
MRDLSGRVALITGGGRGLGEAICRSLASAGMRVAVADVYAESAESVAGSLACGAASAALQLDVSDETSAERCISDVLARFGRIDVLVNNAGIDRTAAIDEMSVAEWDRIIAVNLRGPFVMSRAVLPAMKAAGSGHIVSIVSTASKRAWPNAAAYHASKWGLLGFSHALWTEVRGYGVKATAVIAGGMRTPFLLDRFPDIDESVLQDPANVADTVRYVLSQPPETVIPEVLVIPAKETSWP